MGQCGKSAVIANWCVFLSQKVNNPDKVWDSPVRGNQAKTHKDETTDILVETGLGTPQLSPFCQTTQLGCAIVSLSLWSASLGRNCRHVTFKIFHLTSWKLTSRNIFYIASVWNKLCNIELAYDRDKPLLADICAMPGKCKIKCRDRTDELFSPWVWSLRFWHPNFPILTPEQVI